MQKCISVRLAREIGSVSQMAWIQGNFGWSFAAVYDGRGIIVSVSIEIMTFLFPNGFIGGASTFDDRYDRQLEIIEKLATEEILSANGVEGSGPVWISQADIPALQA